VLEGGRRLEPRRQQLDVLEPGRPLDPGGLESEVPAGPGGRARYLI
jgi:hypothetical protein